VGLGLIGLAAFAVGCSRGDGTSPIVPAAPEPGEPSPGELIKKAHMAEYGTTGAPGSKTSSHKKTN
jgi:hypothetical protein